MVLEIRLGDVLRLKKKHPCGGDEWRVTRLGADIGLECLKCGRHVMLARSVLERRMVGTLRRAPGEGTTDHGD